MTRSAQETPLIRNSIVSGNGVLGKLDKHFGYKSQQSLCCYTSCSVYLANQCFEIFQELWHGPFVPCIVLSQVYKTMATNADHRKWRHIHTRLWLTALVVSDSGSVKTPQQSVSPHSSRLTWSSPLRRSRLWLITRLLTTGSSGRCLWASNGSAVSDLCGRFNVRLKSLFEKSTSPSITQYLLHTSMQSLQSTSPSIYCTHLCSLFNPPAVLNAFVVH